MAVDINTLLTTVNQSVPELTKLSQETETNLNHAMDRAFWRGILLILIFCAVLLPTAVLYRVLAHKLTQHWKEKLPPQP
jgi:hypothetical protein